MFGRLSKYSSLLVSEGKRQGLLYIRLMNIQACISSLLQSYLPPLVQFTEQAGPRQGSYDALFAYSQQLEYTRVAFMNRAWMKGCKNYQAGQHRALDSITRNVVGTWPSSFQAAREGHEGN